MPASKRASKQAGRHARRQAEQSFHVSHCDVMSEPTARGGRAERAYRELSSLSSLNPRRHHTDAYSSIHKYPPPSSLHPWQARLARHGWLAQNTHRPAAAAAAAAAAAQIGPSPGTLRRKPVR
ncbi:hypothetical protein N8I77_011975 [Diaporthe amygdali]|uniref:Uncharacterized protein n=1 Tax=Phomopsis amygdali TaxID=1214568 RepID=A0AAD9VXN4_PHOAM|nr:hypothetical protein N8I77_011975 [Diaporthe amygdali]